MEIYCKLKWRKDIVSTKKVSFYYEIHRQVIINSAWNEKVELLLESEIDEEVDPHSEVHEVYFEKCVMKKLPKGLSEIIPNIKVLSIHKCGLEEISQEDLKGFKNLKVLLVKNNELTHLPGDLFAENPNVEKISFNGNKLMRIEADILKPLWNLRSANFQDNLKINYKYVHVSSSKLDFWLNSRNFRILDKKLKQCNSTKHLLNNKCLQNDVKKILHENFLKDFTIKVNEKEFKVHKFLLAARSSVFNDIIKNEPDANTIKLVDIPDVTFERILDYLYDDKFTACDGLLDTYAAAAKLQISELADLAADSLMTLIDDENALNIFCLAHKYNNEKLKVEAFKQIKSFFPDKNLKEDLAMNPDAVRKLVAAKREIESFIL